jgi:VWFA-related protein
MTHSIRPTSILLACAIAITAVDRPSGQGAAPPVPQQQPPVFKTGVDVVQLDVSVLDAARQPVRGLTADDFVVFEGGQQRPIVAFTAIDVPPPPSQKPVWASQVDPDVETNQGDVARFVVIVMDDAGTGFDQGQASSARRIAAAVVNELGPSDRAAVVFTHQGVPENFRETPPQRARR